MTHVGANMFTRTAYLPDSWPYRVSVAKPNGSARTSQDNIKKPSTKHSIAGPLCFSGDFICKNRLLPTIVEGDILIVHDTGSYTVAMYSRYNSRCCPPMYGFNKKGNKNEFVILQE